MSNPLTTPVLQARDVILDACRHRLNLTLTEAVCRDLANNAATALIPILEDLQRGVAVAGEIGAVPTDEPPPVRVEIVEHKETAEEMAERLIK